MNKTFLSSFNRKQLKSLADLFNDQKVFQPEVDDNTLAALFACRLKTPLAVRNARALGFIFHALSEELLITPFWQTVADQCKCFESAKGKPINRNTLSSAKYCAVKSDAIDSWMIREYIHILKRQK